MDIKQYLDSTYLDTPELAGISCDKCEEIAKSYIKEAIDEHFKLIMIRPDIVANARKMIDEKASEVLIGTVIGFPEGSCSLQEKATEAEKAIKDGADELDFVVNYQMYKRGKVESVAEEVKVLTKQTLNAGLTAKWIIEIAALREDEIEGISKLIKAVVIENFPADYQRVFLKTSTGFFKTENGKPAGATFEGVELMKKYGSPLPLKAAGGVRDLETAAKMIELGVTRIGTSSAKKLADGVNNNSSAY